MELSAIQITMISSGSALLGVFITSVFTAVNNYIDNKNKLNIEKIKIFEGNKFNVYNKLLLFVSHFKTNSEVKTEYDLKKLGLEADYKGVFQNLGYYNKNIREDLLKMNTLVLEIMKLDDSGDPTKYGKEVVSIFEKLYKEVNKYFDV